MRKFCLVGVLLLTLPAAAKAESCKDMFNGFADQMDRLATVFDKMKTDREVCAFSRSTAIPTQRRIVARIEAAHCPNSAGMLVHARESLQRAIASTAETCRKAGM